MKLRTRRSSSGILAAGVTGARRTQLTQMIDLPATLLEYFGVARPPDMDGIPLGDVIAEDAPTRDAVLFGVHGRTR